MENMQIFHVRYRNTQGTLMRILNAASRRALDMPSVLAEPVEQDHRVTLVLEVTPKQIGQLSRDWYAIADVLEVHSGAGEPADSRPGWAGPHPPASEGSGQSARAALA
jgi:acetolactate synthase small subunit